MQTGLETKIKVHHVWWCVGNRSVFDSSALQWCCTFLHLGVLLPRRAPVRGVGSVAPKLVQLCCDTVGRPSISTSLRSLCSFLRSRRELPQTRRAFCRPPHALVKTSSVTAVAPTASELAPSARGSLPVLLLRWLPSARASCGVRQVLSGLASLRRGSSLRAV